MAGADLRNIALVGHGGAGKTTLAEAMLFAAKAITRQGKVGAEHPTSDFLDDEKESGHSLDSALLHAGWKGKTLQIVDTPGYPDFQGPALRSLDAVDCAVVVVDAFDGPALNARVLFRRATERNLPRIVVVNHCDSDNVNPGELAASLEELGGNAVRAFNQPDAFGPGFSSVTSIFDGADSLKEGFVESAVEADDELMEKYLEEGEVSDDDLKKVIAQAIRQGTLVPVLHTSAEKGVGVSELLDFVADFGPSPLGRTVTDEEGNEIACVEDGPFLGYCFKVMFDRQAGKIAFVRVFRGSLGHGDVPQIARTEAAVKVGHAARYQGNHKSELDHASAGDIVALPKVEDVHIGDTLCAPGHRVILAGTRLPNPMVGYAIRPKARGDESKIGRELGRLVDADACLTFVRTDDTHELVLRGLSTLHLDVALKRLAVAGIEVETSTPKIAYLETINGKAEGHYRHKKQTGGAGQFGEVFLRVEPLERGSEDPLDYVEAITGGSIPRQFLPAIEKGIRQQMQEGVLSGNRVVDVRVAVYDGKFHDVDSKEIAFIIAGRKAFAEAVQKAKPVLLEPVYNVKVVIPSRFMGDISSDLNTRRARISGMASEGDVQIIEAQVPEAEMQTYSTQLRSITAGEGTFSMEFSHYDVVPANVAQQVIAKAKAAAEAEKE